MKKSLLVKIFVALAFVWGCSVNALNTSSDVGSIDLENAATLTVELDAGQNNTKSVIDLNSHFYYFM